MIVSTRSLLLALVAGAVQLLSPPYFLKLCPIFRQGLFVRKRHFPKLIDERLFLGLFLLPCIRIETDTVFYRGPCQVVSIVLPGKSMDHNKL